MRAAVVLFGRDLRVHDHPALAAAHAAAERMVPLFVFDEHILAGGFAAPNRLRLLLDALAHLRSALRERGGDLVLRRGDPVTEAVRLARSTGAEAVYASADVSRHARRREAALADACRAERLRLELCPGVTVVPPGALRPASGGHYRVFTPYWRAWRDTAPRPAAVTPRTLALPDGVAPGRLPGLAGLTAGRPAAALPTGGERAARRRLDRWLSGGLAGYPEHHDDLAGAGTSRLGADLHLGCLSPAELLRRVAGRPGGEEFARQLCWRDFHHQVAADFPAIATTDYRSRGDAWHRDDDAAAAWRAGRTGYPVVDAGMRQLAAEGWLPNRARLVTASFLTKDLYLDWRLGADHFAALLVDGDLANNYGNWQWVAGTGNDTRPNRVLSPVRQALRFDPDGDYVRRYVPELAGVAGAAVHRPWRLPAGQRRGYPEPIVDHDEAAAGFRRRRG